MRKTILACILISLVGCGKAERQQSAEFASYVSEFESLYHISTINVKIELSNTHEFKSNELGVCYSNFVSPDGHILINPKFWDKLNSISQRNLIHHELGHCTLHRQHKDEQYSDGCPKSLMNTYLIGTECFIKHSADLIPELKG